MTDDRGVYRIGGLRPGKYRIKAAPQQIPVPPETRTDGTVEVNYGATYHPGAIDVKSATAVTVGPAGEVTGIDIRMVRIPILRVVGKVSGLPEGFKQSFVQLTQNGGFGGSGAQIKADGHFEIWRLNPGKYTVTAISNDSGEFARSVPVDFELGESDIDNIELRMLPAEDLKGQLEFDDEMARPKPPETTRQTAPGAPAAQQPQAAMSMRRIVLRDPNNMGPMKMAEVAEDGSFTIEKVMPGRYVVLPNGFPAYVKAVRLGQTTEDGPALDLRNGAGGAALTVTLSSAYGGISGVVSDDKGPAAGARVVVRDISNRNITSGAISAADGAYSIKNLPPGKYKLLVLDENESDLMPNGPNPDDFDDGAETIEVRPKETLTRDLKLRPVIGK